MSLYLGNVDLSAISDRDLQDYFGKYGACRATLRQGKFGQGVGFGFIDYDERTSAEEAVNKEREPIINGARFTVSWGKRNDRNNDRPRGGPPPPDRGGGGRYGGPMDRPRGGFHDQRPGGGPPLPYRPPPYRPGGERGYGGGGGDRYGGGGNRYDRGGDRNDREGGDRYRSGVERYGGGDRYGRGGYGGGRDRERDYDRPRGSPRYNDDRGRDDSRPAPRPDARETREQQVPPMLPVAKEDPPPGKDAEMTMPAGAEEEKAAAGPSSPVPSPASPVEEEKEEAEEEAIHEEAEAEEEEAVEEAAVEQQESAFPRISLEDAQVMKVVELRAELAKRGEKTVGTKPQLIERLTNCKA